jgi:hypothetical protein
MVRYTFMLHSPFSIHILCDFSAADSNLIDNTQHFNSTYFSAPYSLAYILLPSILRHVVATRLGDCGEDWRSRDGPRLGENAEQPLPLCQCYRHRQTPGHVVTARGHAVKAPGHAVTAPDLPGAGNTDVKQFRHLNTNGQSRLGRAWGHDHRGQASSGSFLPSQITI